MRILITGACGVTPRAIARSLRISDRLAGASLIGVDRGGNWYGFYEGLYERVYRVPDARDPAYVGLVEEICRKEAIDAAIVSPETEVLFWSARPFPVPVLLPSAAIVGVAIGKKNLYDTLVGSDLIPAYSIVARAELLARGQLEWGNGPVWLRDYSEASSSGMGSIRVASAEEAYAWAYLHPEIEHYMVAQYLPGRNFACCLLFDEDRLLKLGCYERLEYFMGHLVVSGVSGNISRGRLVNDPHVAAAGEQAIRLLCHELGEPARGLFTVDLREAADGAPKVTEINVRHTAGTSALAAGGANLAEAQVLASLGRHDEIGEVVVTFGQETMILRDIDGPPLLIAGDREPEVGEFVGRSGERSAS